MPVATPRATAPQAQAAAGQGQAAPGWLIAPYVDPFGQGRDSLGRGTSPGEIVVVLATDKAAQREREAQWNYLGGVYRDPHAARAKLNELVKQQGWTSAAARVTADPAQLGELRGKEGFFAGAKARAERETAHRVAGAIGPSLERIGAAEARAERSYRASVAGQRTADATGIPRLSAATEAAIGAMAAATDEKTRGEAWRAAQADDACRGRATRVRGGGGAAVRGGGRARHAAVRRTAGRGHRRIGLARAAARARPGGRADHDVVAWQAGGCRPGTPSKRK